MQLDNSDLFSSEATRERFLPIAPLIDTPEIDAAFRGRDKAAMRAKKQYHTFGQIAILLVACSAIFMIAETLVLSGFWSSFVPTFVAALMAGIGIILQIYLIATRQKTKWLLNRFAAERLRAIKFQSFSEVLKAQNTDELQTHVGNYIHAQISKLENELNAGIAVLKYFSPAQALAIDKRVKTGGNAAMAKMAEEAYQEMRIDYQRNYALSQVTRLTSRRRVFNSTQDMTYLAAAILAFLSLGLKIAERFGYGVDTAWIDFLAVTFFIIGATEAIMDNATIEEQSQTRFEQYVRDIDDVKAAVNNNASSFLETMTDMEKICLDELDHFCRAADRISYRF